MDLRVESIMREHSLNDKSFQEKDSSLGMLFGLTKYTKQEVREIWLRGIRLGVEKGLWKASLDGQKIELNNNTIDLKHKEFLEKFYKLAEEYKCTIQYHPAIGMTVISL